MTDGDAYGRRVVVGSVVEILPAYDMETRSRSRVDELTHRLARVARDAGADLEVDLLHRVDGQEVWGDEKIWINRGRLVWRSGRSG